MRRDIPLLTGTIQAYPTILYPWICPKCKALHFMVKVTPRDGEPVVACENERCKEIFDPTQFKFHDLDKLKRILREAAPELYAESMMLAERELNKEEMGDANASL